MARKDGSSAVVLKQGPACAPAVVLRRSAQAPAGLVGAQWAAQVQQTRQFADALQVLWSGNDLSAEQRGRSVGRHASRWLEVALALHNSLGPAGLGTPEERAEVKASLDATLGGLDGGSREDAFETRAVVGQLAFATVCMELADELEGLQRRLRDTALSVGASGVEHTQLAVGQLRHLVKARPRLRSVTPVVFDELRRMTAKARAARQEKEREAAHARTPTPTQGSGAP